MNQQTDVHKKNIIKPKKNYRLPTLKAYGSIVLNTGGAGTQANESAAMML